MYKLNYLESKYKEEMRKRSEAHDIKTQSLEQNYEQEFHKRQTHHQD